MHYRYEHPDVKRVFGDENKLLWWQKVEVAVMQADSERGDSGDPTGEEFLQIRNSLETNPFDIEYWKAQDKELQHDLNAFLAERMQHILPGLQRFLHMGITSYDTEESGFVKALKECAELVLTASDGFLSTLESAAMQYQFTPMLLRTHGQWAEVGSFGKRILSWIQEVRTARREIVKAMDNLKFAKISGACGNYTSIDPAIEKRALETLGLEPYYGATQILPRVLFAPLASALCMMTEVINSIAIDFRLGARSGEHVLHQEPFGKKQMGSSIMPGKKNTILCEQIAGLTRMVRGFLITIMCNISTWEERAIEQSCAERNAWPDLFHAVLRVIKNMNGIISGMRVYPERMMMELVSSRGCYATAEAQRVLKALVTENGGIAKDAYRMIQLAAFGTMAHRELAEPKSLSEAEVMFESAELEFAEPVCYETIKDVIRTGKLQVSSQLDSSEVQVARWNVELREIFSINGNRERWEEVFTFKHLMRNEHVLYEQILGSK